MGHLLNINNLDMGSVALKVQGAKDKNKVEIPLGHRQLQ